MPLIGHKTYFFLRKLQQEVNTMVKHYKTQRKTNVLQHAGTFDVYLLRQSANRSYYTPK